VLKRAFDLTVRRPRAAAVQSCSGPDRVASSSEFPGPRLVRQERVADTETLHGCSNFAPCNAVARRMKTLHGLPEITLAARQLGSPAQVQSGRVAQLGYGAWRNEPRGAAPRAPISSQSLGRTSRSTICSSLARGHDGWAGEWVSRRYLDSGPASNMISTILYWRPLRELHHARTMFTVLGPKRLLETLTTQAWQGSLPPRGLRLLLVSFCLSQGPRSEPPSGFARMILSHAQASSVFTTLDYDRAIADLEKVAGKPLLNHRTIRVEQSGRLLFSPWSCIGWARCDSAGLSGTTDSSAPQSALQLLPPGKRSADILERATA